jgi:hypothetical protein
METTNTIIFGRWKNSTPQATTVRGESGWWIVPPGFYMKPNPKCPSETIASPNSDFSGLNYYCTLADDGQSMAFQDLLLLKMIGQDNPYGLTKML